MVDKRVDVALRGCARCVTRQRRQAEGWHRYHAAGLDRGDRCLATARQSEEPVVHQVQDLAGAQCDPFKLQGPPRVQRTGVNWSGNGSPRARDTLSAASYTM